jgi:hypothetical protein
VSSARWTITLACLLFAAALVASDIWIAVRKPPTKVKTTTGEETRGSIPGTEIVTSLADKAPRLAAAFSFVLLAAVSANVLQVSMGTEDS